MSVVGDHEGRTDDTSGTVVIVDDDSARGIEVGDDGANDVGSREAGAGDGGDDGVSESTAESGE